jgi:CHASE3 domain sensor protein
MTEMPGRSTRMPGGGAAWLVGAFAVAVLLLLAIALFGVRQNEHTRQARAYAAAALQIEQAALDLVNVSTLMEVHQRGYLVAGDPRALGLRDAQYRRGLL